MRITVEVMLIVAATIGVFTSIRWLISLALHTAAKLWRVRPKRPNRIGQLEQRLDALETRMAALEATSLRIIDLLEGQKAAA